MLPALQALDDLQAQLDAITTACQRCTAAIASSKANTADLLAETDRLQSNLAVRETRSQLVHKFLTQYQLSQEEVYALQVSGSGR